MFDPQIVENESIGELISRVETDILLQLIKGLKKKKLIFSEAQEVAKVFLNMSPYLSKEDLIKKLKVIVHTYPQVQPVFVKYAEPFYANSEKKVLVQMEDYLKKGDIDDAVKAGHEGGV